MSDICNITWSGELLHQTTSYKFEHIGILHNSTPVTGWKNQHFTSIMTLIECFIWHDGDMCCTKLYTCMQTDPSIEVHSGLHAMRIKNALLHEHVCRICVTLTCSVYLSHGENTAWHVKHVYRANIYCIAENRDAGICLTK